MRDGASRPFILSCGIRRFALIASQKSHDTFCFCLYRAINSGRELVCAKKNLRLISKRIVRFLIATPRGRRTYPESRINRWLITRRCAVRRAKPAVSRDICGEPWPGSGHWRMILDRGLLIPISIGAWATLLNDSTLVVQLNWFNSQVQTQLLLTSS
jgi:hypothetical protein